MTREEMRREVVGACDYALSHPRILGADYVKIVKALREVVIIDDAAVDKLASVYQAQNAHSPPTEPEKKG